MRARQASAGGGSNGAAEDQPSEEFRIVAVTINMKDMLEAGAHYGHQARRWNPKMKPYIFGERNGIHIIDLQKTVRLFKKACDFLEHTTSRGGHVLFVGTKRMARDVVSEEATRANQFFINHRWLGGTLTNLQTIRQSIHRLKRIEKMEQDGTFEKLTKKEVLNIRREHEKLVRNLGGMKDMPGIPSALFIVDAHKEAIALQEAARLGIPVVAITDTNADPTGIAYPIPGNDDSLKSIQLFIRTAAEACLAGRMRSRDKGGHDEKYDSVEAGKFYDDQGHSVAVEKAKRPDRDDEPVY
jgi:small subunit ribosomal protein S2